MNTIQASLRTHTQREDGDGQVGSTPTWRVKHGVGLAPLTGCAWIVAVLFGGALVSPPLFTDRDRPGTHPGARCRPGGICRDMARDQMFVGARGPEPPRSPTAW
jgi:hypothetical protein